MKEKSVCELEKETSSGVGYDSEGRWIKYELNTELLIWHRKKTDNPNIFIMVHDKKKGVYRCERWVEDTAYQREKKKLKSFAISWNNRRKKQTVEKSGVWNLEGYIKIQDEYLRYDSQTWLSNIDYHIHISSLVGWGCWFCLLADWLCDDVS
jgi:hypothetical protein